MCTKLSLTFAIQVVKFRLNLVSRHQKKCTCRSGPSPLGGGPVSPLSPVLIFHRYLSRGHFSTVLSKALASEPALAEPVGNRPIGLSPPRFCAFVFYISNVTAFLVYFTILNNVFFFFQFFFNVTTSINASQCESDKLSF